MTKDLQSEEYLKNTNYNKQEYIKYNRIDSYENFVNYCLKKLGCPVVDVNVSPEQLMDRISDAIQYYIE